MVVWTRFVVATSVFRAPRSAVWPWLCNTTVHDALDVIAVVNPGNLQLDMRPSNVAIGRHSVEVFSRAEGAEKTLAQV